VTEQNGRTSPRLRVDESNIRPPATSLPPSHSGKRFVILACLALLLVWGTLQVAFRMWRANYRERAEFGATQVAPTIDPLASLVPPGTNANAWREAVAETHRALVTLTASNLLDLAQMQSLRADLQKRVDRARAHPEQSWDELAHLWDHLETLAAPILSVRHPRPKLLRPTTEPPLP